MVHLALGTCLGKKRTALGYSMPHLLDGECQGGGAAVMTVSAPKRHMTSPAGTCMAEIAARVEMETLRPWTSFMSATPQLSHSSRTL